MISKIVVANLYGLMAISMRVSGKLVKEQYIVQMALIIWVSRGKTWKIWDKMNFDNGNKYKDELENEFWQIHNFIQLYTYFH